MRQPIKHLNPKALSSLNKDEFFALLQEDVKNFSKNRNELTKNQRMTSKLFKKVNSLYLRIDFLVIRAFSLGRKSQEDINYYFEVYKNIFKRQPPTNIIAHNFKLQGIEIKILKSKKNDVNVESGTIGFGDITIAPNFLDKKFTRDDFSSENLARFVNEGNILLLSVGGDGIFFSEIRLINFETPLLLIKEYKNLLAESSEVLLKIPTGKVRLSDMYGVYHEENKNWNGPEMEIEKGFYKAKGYFINTIKYGYKVVIVLSKVEKFVKNDLKFIQALG